MATGRLAGDEDVNAAERVSADPTFRLIGSENIWARGAALTARSHAFGTERLAEAANLAGLAAINRELIGKAEAIEAPRRVVLDMESPEIPVCGKQEHSAYNGYFESTCDHPVPLFNREGGCLAAKLRPGNVHSAEGWEEVLRPETERQQRNGQEVALRADAAFAKPEMHATLEQRGAQSAIRLPANERPARHVAERLPRPVGRPRHKPLIESKRFRSRAAGWNKARRVVAAVEHHQGELCARVGFIATRVSLSRRAVVRFYDRRGTAEPWIKAGQQATHWTRLSCHRCRAHGVR